MRRLWSNLRSFFEQLRRGNESPTAGVEDSPELEMERERRRGMRGGP
ncbi:MAG: hypothetical protein GY745_12430 [Actinomycetia bacterium]|nr:hypothetical protein [Actinomycetes bacterium]MCP3912577.1 hypothetical protein [Actinomycetes bacterium]MCP4085844.1 hypothetical protein [Actinomycetes bacterium]